MSDRLLTLLQLAQKWGWSRDAVWRLVKKRDIPFVRIGRNHYFREADVDAWLKAKTVQPKAAVVPQPRPRRKSAEEWARELGVDESEVLQ